MTAIFLDTVGLVAMWNRADQWHEAALAAFDLIKSKRHSLITTSYMSSVASNAGIDVVSLRQVSRFMKGFLVIQ
jgi:predicted nucleic acid-binding protein